MSGSAANAVAHAVEQNRYDVPPTATLKGVLSSTCMRHTGSTRRPAGSGALPTISNTSTGSGTFLNRTSPQRSGGDADGDAGFGDRPGAQDLSGARVRRHPGGEVQRGAEVPATSLDRGAPVDAGADLGEQWFPADEPAQGERGVQRAPRSVGDEEELITDALDETRARGEGRLGELLVASDDVGRLLAAVGLGQRGIACEVREEEHDLGRRRHHPSLPVLAPGTASGCLSAGSGPLPRSRPIAPITDAMLASPLMNQRGTQLISLLLIVLAFGLCAPDGAAAETPESPGIVSDGAGVTPACDTGTDDPGLPTSKAALPAITSGTVAVAPVDAPRAAPIPPLPLVVPRQVALEVLGSRAPPLV